MVWAALERRNGVGESKSVEMHGIRRVTSRLTDDAFGAIGKMTKAPDKGPAR